MSNKIDKPKQTAPQLITKMKSKGITFKYITEEKAAEYLTENTITYAPPHIGKIIKNITTVQILGNT